VCNAPPPSCNPVIKLASEMLAGIVHVMARKRIRYEGVPAAILLRIEVFRMGGGGAMRLLLRRGL
jgi:hypothetical protein